MGLPDGEHAVRTVEYSAEKLQGSLFEYGRDAKEVLLTTQNIITNTGAALATLALGNGHLMQNQIGAQIREFSHPHVLSDRFFRGNPITEVVELFDVGIEREVDNHQLGGKSPKPVYYFREPEYALKVAVAAFRIAYECPTIFSFLPAQTERSTSSASTLETLITVARCLEEKGCVGTTDIGKNVVWNKLLTRLKDEGVLVDDQYKVSLSETPSRVMLTAAPSSLAMQVEQVVAQELQHSAENVTFKQLQERVVAVLHHAPSATVLANINRLRTTGKLTLTASNGYVLPKNCTIEPIYQEGADSNLTLEYATLKNILSDPLHLHRDRIEVHSFEVHRNSSILSQQGAYPAILRDAIFYFVNKADSRG